jgi:hypothetical protein
VGRAGEPLKKVNSRSGLSLINLSRCIASNSVSMKPNPSGGRSSLFDGLSAAGGPEKEIVRQQWNFSPAGSTTEIEDYAVDLDGISVLELAIQPDVGRRDAVATLAVCRLR